MRLERRCRGLAERELDTTFHGLNYRDAERRPVHFQFSSSGPIDSLFFVQVTRMSRSRPVQLIMTVRSEKYCRTRQSRRPAQPHQNDGCNAFRVMSVHGGRGPRQPEVLLCSSSVHTGYISLISCYDDRHRQGARQRYDCDSHGTYLPGPLHTASLASLRPEKVEEEGRSEDEGDRDAGKDVEGGSSHDVVVVHVRAVGGAQLLDERLLLYIISDSGGAHGFRADTTHHGKLVDDHLGSAKVVNPVEHVG